MNPDYNQAAMMSQATVIHAVINCLQATCEKSSFGTKQIMQVLETLQQGIVLLQLLMKDRCRLEEDKNGDS